MCHVCLLPQVSAILESYRFTNRKGSPTLGKLEQVSIVVTVCDVLQDLRCGCAKNKFLVSCRVILTVYCLFVAGTDAWPQEGHDWVKKLLQGLVAEH